ncbi:MAG: SDR family NAD(P)-dependent oxidoreductase [Pseudomonadales bacterium]
MTKTAVITGAGTGIGYHLSLALLASNIDIQIITIGRRSEPLRALRLSYPQQVLAIAADVATPEGRNSIVQKLSNYAHIDYLVHAAATVQPLCTIKHLSLTDWRNSLHTNVEGPLFLTQLLLEKFDHSRVLFFTSEATVQPVHGASSYCVSKVAQQMVYECFKAEVSPQHASFGMVSPGLVDTPMQAVIRQADPRELPAVTAISQLYNENKLLTADTVARFVTWLLLTVKQEDFSRNIWDIDEAFHQSSWIPTGQV